MGIYEIVFRIAVFTAISTVVVAGGIAHMMLKAEIKEIKRDLMQMEADMKRIERRLY